MRRLLRFRKAKRHHRTDWTLSLKPKLVGVGDQHHSKSTILYKKSTSASQKIERTYTMAVHVRAVQDELPAGTERLLGILENSIKEVPESNQ